MFLCYNVTNQFSLSIYASITHHEAPLFDKLLVKTTLQLTLIPSPVGLHVDRIGFPNMHTSCDSSCAYRGPICCLSRRYSLDGRHVPPILGRNGPFSEPKKRGFRESCVRACESEPTATTHTDETRSNVQPTSTTATRRKPW
ncbi:hypothetical protein FEJ81_16480 [Natrinema versiforme]|uniref:Uncharacterized protein n=1 Tax=Natrinema versiforme TaxID=88724 RepID=A0A4P8WNA0_9EURY|nr:hypothetical protein FEJ81_16480 [Natrinema versiforme]